jgi:hypothetical protein
VHLLDHISHKIALKAGGINAHELALAGKVGLAATLLYLAFPGDKMILPRQVGERNTSQLEHYDIVMEECIASEIGPSARLPFCKDLLVTTAQMVVLIVWNDGSMDTTLVVRFFELEEVRTQTYCLA